MGLRIITGFLEGNERFPCAVMYCSVTDWAFGPIMRSQEEALAFIEWLPKDARVYKDSELESKYSEFRKESGCAWCSDFLVEGEGRYRVGQDQYCVPCAKEKGYDKLAEAIFKECKEEET